MIKEEKAYVVDDDYKANSGKDFVNDGYTFQGWNTMANGSGTAVPAGSRYSPPNDITLYAQWKKNEERVKVFVYTWKDETQPDADKQYDYTVEFVEPDGRSQYTTSSENDIYFTKTGLGTMRVKAPGLFVYPGNGEKFTILSDGVETLYTYDNDYSVLDGETATREITFKIGEFSTLYVHKMPIGQSLQRDGQYHLRAGNYGDGGTLFGGHKYRIHWYDDFVCKYKKPSVTSNTVHTDYTCIDSDNCFVNVAHKGAILSHTMHAWLGYAYRLGEDIPRYDPKATYSEGDMVVYNRKAADSDITKKYDYAVVYKYHNDTSYKGKTPPYSGNDKYWHACNDMNGENIYVYGYVDRDSVGPFPALSAVDLVRFDDLSGIDASGAKSKNNFYPNYPKETGVLPTPNCTFPVSRMVIDLSDKPRDTVYYIGYGVQDNSSGCAGIKFRATYKVQLI